MFDLNELDTSIKANSGINYTLRHPRTNAKTTLSVTLLGADSDKMRKVQDTATDAIFKEIAQLGKVGTRSAESTREDRIEAVAECIVGWSGFARAGEVLECTRENKIAVLSHPGFAWILDQIEIQIRDRANFLPE
jgi:hypothetical protein